MNVTRYREALARTCATFAAHASECDEHACARQAEHDEADARVLALHEEWKERQQ